MTTTALNETQRYLKRVEELEPVLREHDADNERERRLVRPVVDALREAGMFRMCVPRHYGGSQLHPVDACRVVSALAEIDSAAGWNAQISAAAASLLAVCGSDVTDVIYADGPDRIIAGSIATPVVLTPVPEGFEVNGEISFVSGANDAEWFMSFGIQLRDGQPLMDPSGERPVLYVVYFGREAVEVLDTWHVAAMRGTGSTNVKIEGARVPESWVVEIQPGMAPSAAYAAPEYLVFPWPNVHGEAAVSMGIARAAIRDLVTLATTKVAAAEMQTIQHRERVQHNLALATALVDAAQAYMTEAMSAAYDREAIPDAAAKVTLQLSACMAARNAAQAVDLVCEAAGTSSARLEYRFERYFRDVHFLEKHASKSVERITNVGRMLLGMPSGWIALEL